MEVAGERGEQFVAAVSGEVSARSGAGQQAGRVPGAGEGAGERVGPLGVHRLVAVGEQGGEVAGRDHEVLGPVEGADGVGGEGGVVVARLGLAPSERHQVGRAPGGEEAQRGGVHAAGQVRAQPALLGRAVVEGRGESLPHRLGACLQGQFGGWWPPPAFLSCPLVFPHQAVVRGEGGYAGPEGPVAQRRRQEPTGGHTQGQGLFVDPGTGHRGEDIGPVGCHLDLVRAGAEHPAQSGRAALEANLPVGRDDQVAGAGEGRGERVRVGHRPYAGGQFGEPGGGDGADPDHRHPHRTRGDHRDLAGGPTAHEPRPPRGVRVLLRRRPRHGRANDGRRCRVRQDHEPGAAHLLISPSVLVPARAGETTVRSRRSSDRRCRCPSR